MFSQADMADIENASMAGLATIRIDGANIKSDISSKTDVQQKAEKEEKKQKTKSTLKNLGKSLLNNTTIRTN